jgi:AraC-like DNA-binding protein
MDWCQGLVGQLMLADVSDLPPVTTSALNDAPVPVNRVESLVLRAILLDLGLRLVRHFHSHKDVSVLCPCSVESGEALMQFWNGIKRDVLQDFAVWMAAFVEIYNRTHPPMLAERAARIIRRGAAERMGAAHIASQCGCTVPTLRHAFCARYGVSLREYQRIARVTCAVPRVRSGVKIEAVALEAGYHSKKDFYKVFRQVTGLTPVQFRNLPSSRAGQLVSDARSRLVLRPAHRQQDR